jgi:2-polyprenyl-6-methoxyphenol hydroxylase-like FAD-dependent oxidoreductase
MRAADGLTASLQKRKVNKRWRTAVDLRERVMTASAHVQVAVVGAGPTGLALATVLRAARVDAVVLDQAAAGANTSRAAVVHARTLEVLEQLDVTPRLLAEGCTVPVFTIRDRTRVLARLDFADLPTAYPYTLMLPQSRIEAILGERLADLGGTVQRPWQVSDVTTRGGIAVLEGRDEHGRERTLTADYVVGADGMHSTVRQSAGIAFQGNAYPASFVLADVRMHWPLSDKEVQLFFAPAGLVVVAPLPGGHHRVVATVDEAPEIPDGGLVQKLLEERGPGAATVDSVAWSSRFRVHHRVAEAYRRGPVFLAGDAAHVHSPAGGQGMNIGIQDAVDLGSTLANVLAGRADETALQGYEARRRPLALEVVRLTDRATRMATLRGRPARAGRNVALSIAGRVPAVRQRLARQLAELPADR